jgi:hypothetical protein
MLNSQKGASQRCLIELTKAGNKKIAVQNCVD